MQTEMHAIAELRGVTLALGGRDILKNLDFTIEQGKFIGLLGANGSGKTTLLRALLGLVRPHAGTLRVFGQPARSGQPRIGYLPQSRGQMAELRLSGRDFISAACGGGWGTPWLTRAQKEDVARVIHLVQAAQFVGRCVSTLSGGERQRLALAQALLGAPDLLLLDEPLSNLDPHHQAAVIALVHDIQKTLGISVIFSAHELNALLPVLDQVLYLGQGHAALGSVEQVITAENLSRLYGAPIEVVRVQGRVFVMSGGVDMERDAHVHL